MSTTEGKLGALTPDSSVHMDAVRGLAALTVFLGHGRGLFLQTGIHDAILGGQAAAPAAAVAPAPVPAAAEAANSGGATEAAVVDGPIFRATIGHEAVIVFFVLSGYFVGGSVMRSVRKGSFSWGRYLYQRLTRLWVALIPAVLLTVALDLCGGLLLKSSQNIYSGPPGQYDVAAGVLSRLIPPVVLGNIFFVQGILVPLLGTNVSLWSLAYEFWYYLFFPLLVTMCVASSRLPARILSALLLVVSMRFCGIVICADFGLWLMGAGVALLPLALPAKRKSLVTGIAGIVFLTAIYLEMKYPINLYLSDFLLGIVFTFFLWTILHATRSTVSSRYRSTAQFLSNMSYTLYLVHMPCFVLISALLMPVWHAWPLSLQSLFLVFPIYVFVFLVCWLMYFCFERNTDKIRNWVSAMFSRRTSYAPQG